MSSSAGSTVQTSSFANAFSVKELEWNGNSPDKVSLSEKINEWLQQNPEVFVTHITYLHQGSSRIAYITWRRVK